jgi:hypothetical protein
MGFNPTITLIVATKKHNVVFFPRSNADGDQKGNCRPGTVIDTDVVSPEGTDYYLYGHAGLLGTSKPAHFNILVDENDFTCVQVVTCFLVQLLSNNAEECFTVCMTFTDLTASNVFHLPFVTCMPLAHVQSRSPLHYSVCSYFPHFCLAHTLFIHIHINTDAHNVCTRAKNHYDPEQVHRLFSSDMARTEDTPDQGIERRLGGNRNTAHDGRTEFQSLFRQAHERQASRMYFL